VLVEPSKVRSNTVQVKKTIILILTTFLMHPVIKILN
jgi:hypothetical protein